MEAQNDSLEVFLPGRALGISLEDILDSINEETNVGLKKAFKQGSSMD